MRISIAVLFVAVNVAAAFPYQSISPNYRSDLAQGYIQYVDPGGSQRFVSYSYPKPVYVVQRRSFDVQKQAENPWLKTVVQPDFIETVYTSMYQDSLASQEACENHFRAWNLQRYQALKSEADKLYAQGQMPSADMLQRLKQLEQMSKATVPNETPEVKQAREEHLKLWHEAREQARIASKTAYAKAYAAQSAGAGITETPEVQHAKEEHLRLWNEAKQRAEEIDKFSAQTAEPVQVSAAPALKTAEASKPSEFSQQQQFVSSVSQQPQQIHEGKLSYDKNEQVTVYQAQDFNAARFTKTQEQSHDTQLVSAVITETPEVQHAKEEHLRLWSEAKLRAEEDNKFSSNTQFATAPLLKSTQSQKDTAFLISSVFQQPAQSNEADTLAIIQAQETEQEKAELAAEQQREMQRIRQDEQMRQLELSRDAERMKEEQRQMQEEQRQMKAERIHLRAEDEARLRSDLSEQFKSEHALSHVATPAGVYVISNRYQQNPFHFNLNTPAAALRGSQYYSISDGKIYGSDQNLLQLQPGLIYYDKQAASQVRNINALPGGFVEQKLHTAADAKAVNELEKATREHFHAHEIALKQLQLANHKGAHNENCN